MPTLVEATPRITVRLYKTIARDSIDGRTPVSSRYSEKSSYIDLTPYLGDGSSVITSKSVRDPAGAFAIMFADRPQRAGSQFVNAIPTAAIESIYGLVEPQDMIEIRMWSGVGAWPGGDYPIKMRGFVSSVSRSQIMSQDGKPIRQVSISGQDFGKIWQMYQVLYLPAYAAGTPLLTTLKFSQLFGTDAQNVMKAAEFVQAVVEKVINPFLDEMLPKNTPLPRSIRTDKYLSVSHGVINNNYQDVQGNIYTILATFADIGVWNELYIEDHEDGVHCVYRPVPALAITKADGKPDRRIQDDAPEPIFCDIPDDYIVSITTTRTDANVANFFWVNNSRFDMIDDLSRRLMGLSGDNQSVNLKDYPNSAAAYYGVRPMYAATQQAGDEVTNAGSGQNKEAQDKRSIHMEAWIDNRRRLMAEMNKDNVIFESGEASVKGCPMRPDGVTPLKAGDYARFITGAMSWVAYVHQVVDEFQPYQSYKTSLRYERGENFIARSIRESGQESPWLLEQATRGGMTEGFF